MPPVIPLGAEPRVVPMAAMNTHSMTFLASTFTATTCVMASGETSPKSFDWNAMSPRAENNSGSAAIFRASSGAFPTTKPSIDGRFVTRASWNARRSENLRGSTTGNGSDGMGGGTDGIDGNFAASVGGSSSTSAANAGRLGARNGMKPSGKLTLMSTPSLNARAIGSQIGRSLKSEGMSRPTAAFLYAPRMFLWSSGNFDSSSMSLSKTSLNGTAGRCGPTWNNGGETIASVP